MFLISCGVRGRKRFCASRRSPCACPTCSRAPWGTKTMNMQFRGCSNAFTYEANASDVFRTQCTLRCQQFDCLSVLQMKGFIPNCLAEALHRCSILLLRRHLFPRVHWREHFFRIAACIRSINEVPWIFSSTKSAHSIPRVLNRRPMAHKTIALTLGLSEYQCKSTCEKNVTHVLRSLAANPPARPRR